MTTSVGWYQPPNMRGRVAIHPNLQPCDYKRLPTDSGLLDCTEGHRDRLERAAEASRRLKEFKQLRGKG